MNKMWLTVGAVLFAAALPTQPAPHFYSADGVHPNAEGAMFIGKHCAAAIEKVLNV